MVTGRLGGGRLGGGRLGGGGSPHGCRGPPVRREGLLRRAWAWADCRHWMATAAAPHLTRNRHARTAPPLRAHPPWPPPCPQRCPPPFVGFGLVFNNPSTKMVYRLPFPEPITNVTPPRPLPASQGAVCRSTTTPPSARSCAPSSTLRAPRPWWQSPPSRPSTAQPAGRAPAPAAPPAQPAQPPPAAPPSRASYWPPPRRCWPPARLRARCAAALRRRCWAPSWAAAEWRVAATWAVCGP